MKKAIIQVLEPITNRIREVLNTSKECQEMMKKIEQQYLASTTAKHTKEEWEKIKESLLVSCTLDYIRHNKKLKKELGKAFYEELRED